jgi:hypothetical protein
MVFFAMKVRYIEIILMNSLNSNIRILKKTITKSNVPQITTLAVIMGMNKVIFNKNYIVLSHYKI